MRNLINAAILVTVMMTGFNVEAQSRVWVARGVRRSPVYYHRVLPTPTGTVIYQRRVIVPSRCAPAYSYSGYAYYPYYRPYPYYWPTYCYPYYGYPTYYYGGGAVWSYGSGFRYGRTVGGVSVRIGF